MVFRFRPRSMILIVAICVLAIPITGLVIAWLGIYNVAASRGHWPITEWFLEFVMRRSVNTHSLPIDPPPLDEDNMIRLGGAHFHGGCAHCHGAPGYPRGAIVEGMLPVPPDLSRLSGQWRERELFWIVKHGIKYTGMPAWPSLQRDDEVWAVVAFLRKLPALDAVGYRDLAMGYAGAAPESGQDIALGRISEHAVSACARCHGAEGHGPPSNLVPILHGQPSEFLIAALQAYAQAKRASGFMQVIAADLTPAAMRLVASYYSTLKLPVRPPAPGVENGRIIATQGVPEAGIPPCLACHGPQALRTYPRLGGQHAAYIKGQLRLWRNGVMVGSETAAIMRTDRSSTERHADRGGVNVLRKFRRAPAHPVVTAMRYRPWCVLAVSALLAACQEVQSVFAPRGPQARAIAQIGGFSLRLAPLCWLSFALRSGSLFAAGQTLDCGWPATPRSSSEGSRSPP